MNRKRIKCLLPKCQVKKGYPKRRHEHYQMLLRGQVRCGKTDQKTWQYLSQCWPSKSDFSGMVKKKALLEWIQESQM